MKKNKKIFETGWGKIKELNYKELWKSTSKLSKIVLLGVAIFLIGITGLLPQKQTAYFRDLWSRMVDNTGNIWVWLQDYDTLIIKSVVSIVIVIFTKRIINKIILSFSLNNQRKKTFLILLSNVISYLSIIIIVLILMNIWNVNTTAFFATLGIFGLVVGFASQKLIEDVISGFIIIVEDQFKVGDIIVVDGFRGTVQFIGLRTTHFVDAGGDIKIMSNGHINNLINYSKSNSLAITTIGISYESSIILAENVLEETFKEISKNPMVIDGPYNLGVDELADSAVIFKIIAHAKEEDKYALKRLINREVKLAFDEAGISIPFPQMVIHQAVTNQVKTGDEKKADKFMEDQRKKTKKIISGIEDSDQAN